MKTKKHICTVDPQLSDPSLSIIGMTVLLEYFGF